MPTYLGRTLWWQRLLVLVPLSLLAVVVMTVVIAFSFQTEAKSSLFVLGAAAGDFIFMLVFVTAYVLPRRRADLRWKAVQKIEPDAIVQEIVMDAPTCVSLSRLGALDSALSMSPYHATRSALTAAFSEDGLRIYGGVRVVSNVADIPWEQVESIRAENTRHSGTKTVPVVCLRLSSPANKPQLFLTVGSSRWSGISSERALDDLCMALRQQSRVQSRVQSGEDSVVLPTPRVWFGAAIAENIGFGARTYFNRFRALVGILGAVYITGWVNSSLVFLTRTAPPVLSGIAASYVNVVLFWLLLFLARRAYVSAFLRETRSGYTSLRWLVGDIPQVDELSGRVVRIAGQDPLSKEEEQAYFRKVRSKA